MSKTKTIKKIFLFVVAMVMMASPVLLAGCSWFKFGPSNQTSPVTPSNPSGGGNGGGNSGGDSGNSQTPSPTDSIYDPPEDNAVDLDNYDQYFQNYRITYVPGEEASRSNFNESIRNQNEDIADKIMLDLYKNYGITEEQIFDNTISEIIADNDGDNKYLVYKYQEQYFIVKLEMSRVKYFTHKDAINLDNNNRGWQWNGSNFNSQSNKNKLQLAEYLILSGKILNEYGSNFTEDSSKDFVSAYSQYFDANLTEIKPEYLTKDDNDNDVLNLDALSDVVSQIDHLGFTETEQQYLANFVFNYIIGTDLVKADNSRFVNAYSTDGENLTIVYNANSADSNKRAGKINNNLYYNRFLTDETYATGELVDNEEIEFIISDTNKNLEGICYYAGEYLKLASQANFHEFILYGYTSNVGIDMALNDDNVNKNQDVTSAVYDNLINVYGTAVDSTGKQFNANVWNYDQNNDGEADKTVTIVDPHNHQTYALFSIRLPYFKNYYNTVSFMIRDMFGELTPEKKSALDIRWQITKHMNYPYDTEFPSVPFVYFNDLDTAKMQLDPDTGDIVMADSGYQSYQSLVVMPEKPVYVKEGIFFINGPKNVETDEQSFELTIYARYYDAETQSYASWEDENGEITQFYKIATEEVPINEEPGDLEVEIDVDLRTILATAIIGGDERGSYLLDAFSEDNERVTEQTLVTKESYGYWFNQVSTPDGATVVCFDGKLANSPSYLEFVFYNPSGYSFVFEFLPDSVYFAE